MFSMWLYVLAVFGPVVAVVVAVAVYVIERPTVATRWLNFFDRLDERRAKRRRKP
jgi:hypothetical protein